MRPVPVEIHVAERVLLRGDRYGCLDIAFDKGVQCASQHRDRLVAHAGDVDQGLDVRLIADLDANVGDARRVVPHPLEVGDDV